MLLKNSCLIEPFQFEAQFNHTVLTVLFTIFVLLLKFQI